MTKTLVTVKRSDLPEASAFDDEKTYRIFSVEFRGNDFKSRILYYFNLKFSKYLNLKFYFSKFVNLKFNFSKFVNLKFKFSNYFI